MKPTLRLLYAEDNPQDADMTRAYFAEHAPEFELQIVATGAACLEQIQISPPDPPLLDHRLPDTESVTLLPTLLRQIPGLPVVIVTGVGDEALVVRLLSLGATHCVPEHDNYLETLPDLLRDVLAEHRSKLSQGRPAVEAPQINRFSRNGKKASAALNNIDFRRESKVLMNPYTNGSDSHNLFHQEVIAKLPILSFPQRF